MRIDRFGIPRLWEQGLHPRFRRGGWKRPLIGLPVLSFAAIPPTLSLEAPCEEGGFDEKRRSPEEIGVFEMREFPGLLFHGDRHDLRGDGWVVRDVEKVPDHELKGVFAGGELDLRLGLTTTEVTDLIAHRQRKRHVHLGTVDDEVMVAGVRHVDSGGSHSHALESKANQDGGFDSFTVSRTDDVNDRPFGSRLGFAIDRSGVVFVIFSKERCRAKGQDGKEGEFSFHEMWFEGLG